MAKRHLKQLAAPKTWTTARKARGFVHRPHAGAHSMQTGLSIQVLLRDILHIAADRHEVEFLLHSKDGIVVDGKRIADTKYIVGLFDVISFPKTKEHFRVVLDTHGRVTATAVDAKEAATKVCQIKGKTIIKGSKKSVALHDGRSTLFDKDCKVGDSVVFDLEKGVQKVLPLGKDALVFLTGGKHLGSKGTVQEIISRSLFDDLIVVNTEKGTYTTPKRFAFVVGKNNKEEVTVQ